MKNGLDMLLEKEPRPLRGIKEIANFLGYHESHVRSLIKQGKLPVYREPTGRCLMYDVDYYQTLKPLNGEERGKDDGEGS